jgi:murein peptide amidase A
MDRVLTAYVAAGLLAALPHGQPVQHWNGVLGYSHGERPILVHRLGDFSSPRKILVFGCIHGNECAGVDITQRLRHGRLPAGLDLWIVHNLNPDGRRLGTRLNGRGVDLNRNFGSEWIPIGRRWDPEYSGPRPWSERETRLARQLVRRVRPDVTIWYHQPQALVRAWGGSREAARRYARLARDGGRTGLDRTGRTTGFPEKRPSWSSCRPAGSDRQPSPGMHKRCGSCCAADR